MDCLFLKSLYLLVIYKKEMQNRYQQLSHNTLGSHQFNSNPLNTKQAKRRANKESEGTFLDDVQNVILVSSDEDEK